MPNAQDYTGGVPAPPLSQTKTATWTPLHGVRYLVDTSGGAFSVPLRNDVPVGFWFEIQEQSQLQWTTNNLTVTRNGNTINDAAEDYICDVGRIALRFTKKATGAWESNGVAILSVNPDTALVKLGTIEAANDASLEFIDFVDTAKYISYKVVMHHMLVSSDGGGIYFRVSADSGVTWLSSSGAYESNRLYGYGAGASNNSVGATYGYTGVDIGTVGTYEDGQSGELNLFIGDAADKYTHFITTTRGRNSAGGNYLTVTAGDVTTKGNYNSLQIIPSSPLITSGTATLMGVRK